MKHKRKAIAMIELIFSIVVMGIAMLAIPMITSQTIKGGESALMQESVSAVASELQMILVKPWDQNGINEDLGSPIVATQSTFFRNRAGLTDSVNSRTKSAAQPDAVAIAYNAALDDIGDFNTNVETLTVYNNETNEAYHGNYADTNIRMTTAVAFSPDNINLAPETTFNFDPSSSSATTTNIKRVTTTLTTTTTDTSVSGKNIVLHGFSCNIGAATPSTNSGI